MGKQAETIKRMYTIPEAGIYLGRSEWSIRRLIWDGELPKVPIKGRVHVDIRDMDELIEKNKVKEVA